MKRREQRPKIKMNQNHNDNEGEVEEMRERGRVTNRWGKVHSVNTYRVPLFICTRWRWGGENQLGVLFIGSFITDCNNSSGIRHVSFPNQMILLFLGIVYGLSHITSLKRLVPVAKLGNLMILMTLIWVCADFCVNGPTLFLPSFTMIPERGYAHQRYSERGAPAQHLPPWKLMGRIASCTMSRSVFVPMVVQTKV